LTAANIGSWGGKTMMVDHYAIYKFCEFYGILNRNATAILLAMLHRLQHSRMIERFSVTGVSMDQGHLMWFRHMWAICNEFHEHQRISSDVCDECEVVLEFMTELLNDAYGPVRFMNMGTRLVCVYEHQLDAVPQKVHDMIETNITLRNAHYPNLPHTIFYASPPRPSCLAVPL
jgi:hypothetical protein